MTRREADRFCRMHSYRTRVRCILQGGLLAILCVSQLGHAQVLDRLLGRYPAKDSRMLARSQSEHDLHWLDNERIVFIGSKPGETRVENGRQFPKADLFRWNITTGDI